ncbi:hypothetical protein VME0621_01250 [Vibrio mediterranei]|uniref:glycine zipper family protein n=1 Tax=Vibrio mediterranei TaxID=689 RepID=UPI0007F55D05|nr:glycine zipper family protein [Vibrio mediterranei]SBO09157.1 hypothetical protein VME0621_01250 [Vibrio mediterranei]
MKMNTLCWVTLWTVSSVATANVIVDTKGVDMEKYHADMYECQQLAGQVQQGESGSVAGAAVGTAARGAALGAAGTAIAGGHGSEGAKVGAGVGLVGGMLGHRREEAENEAEYQQESQKVVRNCLTERGYTVLN